MPILAPGIPGTSNEGIEPLSFTAISISVLGFLVRFYTIGTTPKGTSGRNTKEQVADVLNSSGMYSMLRHPLYLGNYLIWLGISLASFNIYFAIIMSLLYRFKPDECKLILIDPKMLELSIYEDIPHLLTPVVTNPGKAVFALKWVVREMENRYKLMSTLNVKNINSYNEKSKKIMSTGKKIYKQV